MNIKYPPDFSPHIKIWNYNTSINTICILEIANINFKNISYRKNNASSILIYY